MSRASGTALSVYSFHGLVELNQSEAVIGYELALFIFELEQVGACVDTFGGVVAL